MPALAFSQKKVSNDIKFEHLTVEDGLSSNAVSCFWQDSRGFIWIGTEHGLNRYDGNFVHQYVHDSLDPNSLPGNFITNITEDHDGKLWLSCFDKGISVFDPVTEKFKNYAHDSLNKNSISSGYVNVATVDSKNRVWIAIWDGGLNLYDPAIDGFKHFNHSKEDPNGISSNRIKDIKQDKNGFLWLTTWGDNIGNNCVQKFDPDKQKFYCVDFTGKVRGPDGTPRPKGGSGLTIVHRLLIDSKENIWFGTYLGTYKYVPSEDVFYEYVSDVTDTNAISFNNIRSLCEDDQGNILMGSLGGGLNVYDPRSEKISLYAYDYYNSYSISDNVLRQIFKDNSGRIWVGTYTGGANIITPIKQQFSLITNDAFKATFRNSSDGNRISAFGADKENNIYVYSGSGLSIRDAKKNLKVIPYDPPQPFRGENKTVDQVWELPDGRMLLSGYASLKIYDPKTNKLTLTQYHLQPNSNASDPNWKRILFTKEGSDKIFWVGCEEMPLCKLDASSMKLTEFFVNGKTIKSATDVCDAVSGKIIASVKGNGLAVMDLGTGYTRSFKNDSTPGCLPSNDVNFILPDKNGHVWVGTEAGLLLFDVEKGSFTSPKNGGDLEKDAVADAVLDDGGNTWFITQRSVWKYNKILEHFTEFNRQLGLNSRTILPYEIVRSGNGKFHIACSDGVISFDPRRLHESTAAPVILISGIKLFDAYLKSDTAAFAKKELEFHYDENSLTFEFSGIDLVNPQMVRYKYKLEGLDSNWVDLDKRSFVSFGNLPPGNYTFRVKCTNSFGIPSAKEASLRFTISPPFWKTWWFYALEILAGIALVWGYIGYRERALMREKHKLENIVSERTAEVVQQKEIIEQKNKEVTDSIHYAQRIQSSIIPSDEEFARMFPQSFVFLKPKDIVSGDYYWIAETDNYYFCATVDCTGHGVPGGFMSMLAGSLLNETVNELGLEEPSAILDRMSDKIISSLRQGGSSEDSKDGMDMVICRFTKDLSSVVFSGANNGIYVLSNGKLTEHRGNKQPVGYWYGKRIAFTQTEIKLKKGDFVYTLTDGYADQFGGEKGKKFKYSNFEKLLEENCVQAMNKQKFVLTATFENWKGALEQIDDVLVIGIKV